MFAICYKLFFAYTKSNTHPLGRHRRTALPRECLATTPLNLCKQLKWLLDQRRQINGSAHSASHHRVDFFRELLRSDRLDQVFDRALAHAPYLVGFLIFRRDHDDGNARGIRILR